MASDPCDGITCDVPECQTCSGGACGAANEGSACGDGGTCHNGQRLTTCLGLDAACSEADLCCDGAACGTAQDGPDRCCYPIGHACNVHASGESCAGSLCNSSFPCCDTTCQPGERGTIVKCGVSVTCGCGSGQHCNASGQCVCDGTSCGGCCDRTTCLEGRSHDACGYGGAACQVCSPDDRCEPRPSGGVCNSIGCFVAGTRVAMADGTSKRIELVAPGDLGLGRAGVNRVRDVVRPALGERLLYALNGGTPFVTAGHPFLTADGWKAVDPAATANEVPSLAVGRLAIGDRVLALAGAAVPALAAGGTDGVASGTRLAGAALTDLAGFPADPTTPLYNLVVDGDHTYVANDLVVHNKAG